MDRLIEEVSLWLREMKDSKTIDMYSKRVLNIKMEYLVWEKRNKDFSFYDSFFKEEIKAYVLFLSVLFKIMRRKIILDKVEELILEDRMEWDDMMAVYAQLRSLRFKVADMDNSYERKRVVRRRINQLFLMKCGKQMEYIPWEKRNKNRIIISTDTLLSNFHAPTKIVSELYGALTMLGYEVLVLVNVELIPRASIEFWLQPSFPSYNKYLHHEFEIGDGKSGKIKGYQQIVDKRHFRELDRYMEVVRQWNPAFIWNVGESPAILSLLRQGVTVVDMPCTAGYQASDAQVLLGYAMEGVKELENMEAYIDGIHQKRLTMKLEIEHTAKGRTYEAGDFGFPEDAFIIAVVGMRLQSEVDERFVRLMERIAQSLETVYFVMIGPVDFSWSGSLEGRVNNFGFCKDLVDVLGGVQLFLNPKRQGGGWSAEMAISVDVPVVTLPDCDVANNVGEAFISQSYEEMYDVVLKYVREPAFYESQVSECRKQSKKKSRVDVREECSKMIHQVTSWIAAGEVQ